jgi:hypothetical protein
MQIWRHANMQTWRYADMQKCRHRDKQTYRHTYIVYCTRSFEFDATLFYSSNTYFCK